MKVYRVFNDSDGNDSFIVEADDYNEALSTALEELGWWVAVDPEEEDE
jgi:hypothetical protein